MSCNLRSENYYLHVIDKKKNFSNLPSDKSGTQTQVFLCPKNPKIMSFHYATRFLLSWTIT